MEKQQISYRPIEDIHPYKNNPRDNTAAIQPVAKSIQDFGFRVPILIDADGTIIAGHTRYEAAKLLQITEVPCIMVSDLSEAQVRAYRIADNKVAEASSWDNDVLRAEMEALKALDIELEGTGFSDVELDALLRSVQDEDFEEFFIEPVQKTPESQNEGQSSAEQPAPKIQLATGQTPATATKNGSQLIQCPHCGEWFET